VAYNESGAVIGRYEFGDEAMRAVERAAEGTAATAATGGPARDKPGAGGHGDAEEVRELRHDALRATHRLRRQRDEELRDISESLLYYLTHKDFEGADGALQRLAGLVPQEYKNDVSAVERYLGLVARS
jgi:hypothetical protein